MKKLNCFLVLLLLWANGSVHAASTLDDLVTKVRREAAKDIGFDQERERRFIQERDRQQAKLNKLRSELAVADQKAEKLRSLF